jgi:hypothetical protein
MEREFAKYAHRMLFAAAESIRETASCLLQASAAQPNETAKQMLPALWRRTETYRNQVLAVYTEVLMVSHQQQSAESFQRSESDLTKYGNNRPSGDIGNLSSISPGARASGHELMQRLQQLMPLLDSLEEGVKSFSQKGSIYAATIANAKEVIDLSAVLVNFCDSLQQAFAAGEDPSAASGDQDDDEEDPVGAVRRQIEEGKTTTWDAIKTGFFPCRPIHFLHGLPAWMYTLPFPWIASVIGKAAIRGYD